MATRAKSGWTLERRYRQSQMIREWRPWEKATGPRTLEGKARSSLNASNADPESEGFQRKVEARARRLAAREEWATRARAALEAWRERLRSE